MYKKATAPMARRGRPFFLLLTTAIALLFASAPMTAPTFAQWQNNNKINDPEYMKKYGHWDVLDLPDAYKLNTIHAALLPTGKVLLVAGSGNNRDNFNQYHDDGLMKVLRTVVYDPETNTAKNVATPADFFCGGHAFLQSGNLLVAGGTSGYEKLKGTVTKPAGAMMVNNENPDSQTKVLKKGTVFVNENTGKKYLSTQDVTIDPADKMDHGNGEVMIMHSSAKVFVEAVNADSAYVTTKNEKYNIEGLSGDEVHDIYGQGGPMTLNKQDFRGDNQSYEFDPFSEQYIKTDSLNESRWYPSLPVMLNGDVLAVSGLDSTGIITDTTERFDPSTKHWSWGPNRTFPTYPALFRTQDPNVLFFSGSNAGYGPADKGRDPGFWNVADNTFKPISGLSATDALETSASVSLPPQKGSNDGSQSQKIMVAGGGGIGESAVVTNRTSYINLADPNPAFTNGPQLPDAVRYVNMTVTPWDEVFAAGGSSNYRGKGSSYSHKSYSINPTTNQIKPMADEIVARSYHSGSLLLPDGKILFFGNDPLFNDKDNTIPGTFEQRLEVYTPPQLYAGNRPSLKIDPATPHDIHRGQELSYNSADASEIKTARLIPPSSATHVTNIEQRSVAAVVTQADGKVQIKLPAEDYILPNGWYMLFVTNASGTPSKAQMVHVVN
jgi:hypothetical protein